MNIKATLNGKIVGCIAALCLVGLAAGCTRPRSDVSDINKKIGGQSSGAAQQTNTIPADSTSDASNRVPGIRKGGGR